MLALTYILLYSNGRIFVNQKVVDHAIPSVIGAEGGEYVGPRCNVPLILYLLLQDILYFITEPLHVECLLKKVVCAGGVSLFLVRFKG